MQNKEKIARINELLEDLTTTNKEYSREDIGTHYAYDRVIDLLEQAQTVMDESARNPRPANLPENMPWTERFADPDEDFDPYAYDGSMSLADFDRRQAMIEADRKNAMVDLTAPDAPVEPHDELSPADLQAGKTLKIRFFDLHGDYVYQTAPFSVKWLEIETEAATVWIDDDHPDMYAGWTVYEWNDQKRQWWPYRDEHNAEREYDTGRRA